MAGQTVSNALDKTDDHRQQVALLRDSIQNSAGEFARALPEHVTADRFIRAALTALNVVPKLAECTTTSVMAGLMQAAQLGLEVADVRGQAFLIPRKDGRDGRMKATFQLGYRGMIDLAARGGITVSVDEICENDRYEYEQGTNAHLMHKPALSNRGPVIAYYAVASFADGRRPQFAIAGKEEVEKHRDRFASSRDYKTKAVTGPWATDFDAMARKTLVRQLLNYLPATVELRQAVAIEAQATEHLGDVPYTVPLSDLGELEPPIAGTAGDVIDAQASDALPGVE